MIAKAGWLLCGLALVIPSHLSLAAPTATTATSLLSVASSMSRVNLSDSVGIVPRTVPKDVASLICQSVQPAVEQLRHRALLYMTGEVRDLELRSRVAAGNITEEEAQQLSMRSVGEMGQRVLDRMRNAKRCAVVSNSGVLLHHKHGASIDAPETDLVFRFNDAEIGGELTDHVGLRDDIRILNFKTSGFSGLDRHYEHYVSPNTTTEFTIYVPRRAAVLKDPNKNADKLLRGAFGALDGPGKVFTTGLQGVTLAMSLCDEVWAYGFPDTPNSVHAPFHYFGEMQRGSASANPEALHANVARLEKRLYHMIAINSDVNASDVAVIPGFRSLQCEEPTVTGQAHDL